MVCFEKLLRIQSFRSLSGRVLINWFSTSQMIYECVIHHQTHKSILSVSAGEPEVVGGTVLSIWGTETTHLEGFDI